MTTAGTVVDTTGVGTVHAVATTTAEAAEAQCETAHLRVRLSLLTSSPPRIDPPHVVSHPSDTCHRALGGAQHSNGAHSPRKIL